MILFFGTRLGKKTEQDLPGVSCSYCGQKDTLTAITQANYFHLFWLPLFNIGTLRYAECSHCKKAFFKEEFTEEMNRAIR